MVENFTNILKDNLIIAMFLSFGAGILSSFSPCILSSLPFLLAYIKGTGVKSKRESLYYSLFYSLGLSITFTILGVLAAIFGRMFSFASRGVYIFLASLLIISGLIIIEIIPLKINYSIKPGKKKGYFGAFLLGLISGVVASPCATPYLAAILSIALIKGKIIYGAILLFLYSLGYSILILFTGYSATFIETITDNKKTKIIGKILKTVFGLLILMGGVYLVYLVI